MHGLCSRYIETIQLICIADWLPGIYMIGNIGHKLVKVLTI